MIEQKLFDIIKKSKFYESFPKSELVFFMNEVDYYHYCQFIELTTPKQYNGIDIVVVKTKSKIRLKYYA